jgi:DNA uptake protein ComE-like DNA-binding protein
MNAVLEAENDSTDNSEENSTEITQHKSANVSFSFFLYRLIAYADARRSISSFLFILFVVVVSDIIFNIYLFVPYTELVESISGVNPGGFEELDVGFAPEVWQALLGMILGTLILVISIASQSIPKLIDIYMKNVPSLLYIWFLIISGGHALIIKIYGEIGLIREPSRIFNTHFLLTICSIIAFPYVFYILRQTKPTNIISRIYNTNMDQITALTSKRNRALAHIPAVVEHQQYTIFEALNQLDDILEFSSFKELKADIVHDMSLTLQNYIRLKKDIAPGFFNVSPKVRTDISFKTMVGQFGEMERNQSFYEQKCFRLLGNVYIRLLEHGEFDLSSMVAGEMATLGLTAIEEDNTELVDIIIIRFNTLLRFAIKHGVRNNEPRNLYNLGFYYGNFIKYLVEHKKIDHVKRCFMYLRIYGVEIFKHGSNSPAMYFIVDVIATEMKKVLEQIYHDGWDVEIQNGMLGEMLQVDSPPDFNKEDMARGVLINNGVRVLQFGLALFYQREGMNDFVDRIAKDVLDDLEVLGEATFSQVIEMTSNRLLFSGPTFWEDTDRGNLNIYYTSDQDQIDSFKQRLYELAQTHLKKTTTVKYKLTHAEMELLWEMSRMTKIKEVEQISTNAANFELILGELKNIDEVRLEALISLREKLKFNSENPKLIISTSRQVAVGTLLKIMGNISGNKEQQEIEATVKLNTPNFIFVKTSTSADSKKFDNFSSLTVSFRPLRQKMVYQFEAEPQGAGANGLQRIAHADAVKIIEEL